MPFICNDCSRRESQLANISEQDFAEEGGFQLTGKGDCQLMALHFVQSVSSTHFHKRLKVNHNGDYFGVFLGK